MATQAILHPVDYTSRDYLSLREDLIKVIRARIPDWVADDPSDFGVALVEAFAYVGDILNYYIDRAAAETFLGTASQRQSILNLASLLGYSPTGRLAARVDLLCVNNGPSLARIPGGASVTTVLRDDESNRSLNFELAVNPDTTDGSWSVEPGGRSLLIPAVEGVTVRDTVIGQSSGLAGQSFIIRDAPMINRSLDLRVGSSPETARTYTYVQNLYEATPTDDRFTYRTDDVGVTTVSFGDGISGTIPQLNQNIYATYRIGGGVSGNITPGQAFSPVGFAFTGTITNPAKALGGAQEESTEQVRESAFTAFRTRNSAVTKMDFQDLAQADNRIAKAKSRGNSLGNITVYVAPISSGDPKADPHPGFDAYTVVSRSLTSNVVTLTLSEAPQFTSETITVSGMGTPWDGSYSATAGTGNQITYPRTAANVPLQPQSGVVTLAELDDFKKTREDVRLNLQNRGVLGSIVTVLPYTFRDLKLAVEVGIRPQFRQTAALASVKSALTRLLGYNPTPLNLTIRTQDIHAYLANSVPEIWYATVTLYDGVNSPTPVNTIIATAGELMRVLESNLTLTASAADPGIVNT